VERSISSQRLTDDHHEPQEDDQRRDSDDEPSSRIEISFCQGKGGRREQEVAGQERQFIEQQSRKSGDRAESSPGSESTSGGPAHQDDWNQRANRQESYCLAYGLPSAAGATVRPITPATATSVRAYGRIWNSVDACGL